MAKIKVLSFKECDFGAKGLKLVKAPKMAFEVTLDADKKLLQAMDKDPLLMQDMHAAGLKAYKSFCATVKQKLITFDKLFIAMVDKGAPPAMMEKQVAGLKKTVANEVAVGEKFAEIEVNGAIKKLQSSKADWKKFKIKIAVSITGTIAGLAVSIGMMASSPFSGGAGAVIGIAGLIKSTAALVKDIGAIAIDIDTAVKLMDRTSKFVLKTADSHAAFNTNEASAAILQEFIGISQPSFKTLSDQGDVVKAKHGRLIVRVHDVAKDLDKILKAQSKFKKEFMAEALKRIKAHPTTKKKENLKKIERQLDAELSANYTAVQGLIEKTIKLNQEAKGWEPEIKRLFAIVKKLEKMDNKGLKVMREALKIVGAGLSVIDGNAIVKTSADLTKALVPAGASYAYDKIASKALDGTVFDAA